MLNSRIGWVVWCLYSIFCMACSGGNGAIVGLLDIDPGEISEADFGVTETTLSFCSEDEIPDPPIYECYLEGRGIKKQKPGTCIAEAQLCHGHQATWPFFKDEPYTCTDGAQGVGCYAASDGISCIDSGVCCPCGDVDSNGTCQCPGETIQLCVQLPTFWQNERPIMDNALTAGFPGDQFSSWHQSNLGRVQCADNRACQIAAGSVEEETLCGALEEEEDEETWNGVGVSSACLDAIEDTRRQLQAAAFGSCMERCIDGVLDCMAASNCDDGGSCASSSSYSNCIMGCF